MEQKGGKRRKTKRKGRVSVYNRIVTRTSSTCFHNYDLLKIRIETRSESYYRSWTRHPLEISTSKTIDTVRPTLSQLITNRYNFRLWLHQARRIEIVMKARCSDEFKRVSSIQLEVKRFFQSVGIRMRIAKTLYRNIEAHFRNDCSLYIHGKIILPNNSIQFPN